MLKFSRSLSKICRICVYKAKYYQISSSNGHDRQLFPYFNRNTVFVIIYCLFVSLFDSYVLAIVRDEFIKKFGEQTVENINSQELLAFRERYFDNEGEDLEKCAVPEWQKLPPKIARIKDETLKQFAIFLNRRWKDLCRKVSII